MKLRTTLLFAATFLMLSTVGFAQQKSAKDLIGDVSVGEATSGERMPIILWGGEAATFWANGGVKTTPNSIYAKAGLKLTLTPGDDSIQQARDYLSGKSPYFRGTFRMACLFAEEFNKDPRTKPVMILQLTYSLGDHMVSRANVKTLNDLKGKTICLQQGGPHLGLVEDSLSSVGLAWSDVNIVWAKDLTATDNSPAEMMRKDSKIDVACVVTPDMIGLCSGLDQTGSGAEGTIKGARVLNSTATMSRSVADVIVCRSDYFKAHRDEVQKIVVGYLQATEAVVKARKQYDSTGKSPQYVTAMKQMQKFFTAEALPTIEEDVHGLILDANFVRIPGNEAFFNDPNNLVGFNAKQESGLDMAVKLGYSTQKFGFETAKWDYKVISSAVGVKYVAPVYAIGRINPEILKWSDVISGHYGQY